VDIVYLVKNSVENDSEELRYSLRSLKNIAHGKVFLVGESPAWVKNVIFIPVEQSRTRYENWTMNLMAAATNDAISEDFLMMNDDFFIMKPTSELPPTNLGPVKSVIEQYEARYPGGSDYISIMKRLYEALLQRGCSNPLSYELHTPMTLSKTRVRRLYEDVAGQFIQFRSEYGNYFDLGGLTVPDVKVFIDLRHNHPSYQWDPESYLEQQALLSTTGGAFNRGRVGDFVRSRLAKKSDYEV